MAFLSDAVLHGRSMDKEGCDTIFLELTATSLLFSFICLILK